MQDAVPTLAVLAAFNATPVRFVGIANLRVKECDRVAAMATELSRLSPGLAVEQGNDLVVTPRPEEHFHSGPGQDLLRSSHRHEHGPGGVAGCLGVTILDPGCVGKTYPDYWA